MTSSHRLPGNNRAYLRARDKNLLTGRHPPPLPCAPRKTANVFANAYRTDRAATSSPRSVHLPRRPAEAGRRATCPSGEGRAEWHARNNPIASGRRRNSPARESIREREPPAKCPSTPGPRRTLCASAAFGHVERTRRNARGHQFRSPGTKEKQINEKEEKRKARSRACRRVSKQCRRR